MLIRRRTLMDPFQDLMRCQLQDNSIFAPFGISVTEQWTIAVHDAELIFSLTTFLIFCVRRSPISIPEFNAEFHENKAAWDILFEVKSDFVCRRSCCSHDASTGISTRRDAASTTSNRINSRRRRRAIPPPQPPPPPPPPPLLAASTQTGMPKTCKKSSSNTSRKRAFTKQRQCSVSKHRRCRKQLTLARGIES